MTTPPLTTTLHTLLQRLADNAAEIAEAARISAEHMEKGDRNSAIGLLVTVREQADSIAALQQSILTLART